MTTVTNKNGVEFDIDAIATDLNGKMDIDGTNATCPTLLSRTANSNGGVTEIWSDGYCVQTGMWTGSISISQGAEGGFNIVFDQSYKDTNYIVCFTCEETYCLPFRIASKATYGCYLGFGAYAVTRTLSKVTWRIEGYIR